MFNSKLVEKISYLKKPTYGKVNDSQSKHHASKLNRNGLQVKLKPITYPGSRPNDAIRCKHR